MTRFFQDPELTEGSVHNFICLPVDEYANTYWGQIVIRAKVETHPEYPPDVLGSIPTLHIIEPASFREKWAAPRARYFARTRPDVQPGEVSDALYLELLKEIIAERGTGEDNWMLEALEYGKGIK